MKSVIVCLLLLMNTPYGESAQEEDNPPIFSVEKVRMEVLGGSEKPKGFVDREVSRVVEYVLEDQKEYLMRIDPPEHCTRFIICADGASACGKRQSIMVYPHVGEIYYKKDQATDPVNVHKGKSGVAEEKTLLDDYIKITRVNAQLHFEFKEITFSMKTKGAVDVVSALPESEKVQLVLAITKGMRVETSSFYCNVHVGTTKSMEDVEPVRSAPKKGEAYEIKIDPFEFGKAPSTPRKCFGPLFSKNDAFSDKMCKTSTLTFAFDEEAQCPFAHDWMGFARWSGAAEEAGDKPTIYERNFWKGPAYHYTLGMNTTDDCGKKHENLFTIDIEIDNVFDPTLDVRYARCFGFALAFDKKAPGSKIIDLDFTNTFEFYLVSMMFLAPDSDKIRELRGRREALRKIRISFYDDYDPGSQPGKKAYAIVEYGFLNDRVAGVREYVPLTPGQVQAFTSVTLLKEGFCNVRLLNVNHHLITSAADRCLNIEGCDVVNTITIT